MTKRTRLAALAGGLAIILLAGEPPAGGLDLFIAEAQARVGRPLTPVSYAGVARRTTRRAVAAGAATGAAVYYAPGCAKVVDAYGRIYYRCP
ncbi:hypothetical protein CWR43_00500 [Rhizobium sullae]|uniref:Uncharacterized protein n=1 Tax=Rhizobium sullae TaxID=50338 RepID=A0A2N0DHH6_RHISU|nr:hypothetical protein [Rhizobium sullae]PKA45549.1 hypothetical protein CWR43_00500 [Rhizobium sullae]